jgi:hypothetical protein
LQGERSQTIIAFERDKGKEGRGSEERERKKGKGKEKKRRKRRKEEEKKKRRKEEKKRRREEEKNKRIKKRREEREEKKKEKKREETCSQRGPSKSPEHSQALGIGLQTPPLEHPLATQSAAYTSQVEPMYPVPLQLQLKVLLPKLSQGVRKKEKRKKKKEKRKKKKEKQTGVSAAPSIHAWVGGTFHSLSLTKESLKQGTRTIAGEGAATKVKAISPVQAGLRGTVINIILASASIETGSRAIADGGIILEDQAEPLISTGVGRVSTIPRNG